MAGVIHELRVFMASPGDLVDERESIQRLEQQINAIFDRRNVRVRITGWEQVAPELGRPQHLINPLVNDCDIFVGLLNRRWGSQTGTYSSGFEEEFEIALTRRTDGPTPAIGMFFAEIPADARADPGPQLQAVLKFQERVRKEHLALYRTFRNVDHLSSEILGFLTTHVLRIADEADLGAKAVGSRGVAPATVDAVNVRSDRGPTTKMDDLESAESVVPAIDSPNDSTVGDDLPDEAQLQIAQSLHHLGSWFETPGARPNDRPDYDRATLVGASFGGDDEVLGSHHVHRLYKRRKELMITVGEAYSWYRTYFANYGTAERNDRIVPIWGIIDRSHERFPDDLVRLAEGADVQVARGCLRYATKHHLRPEGLWPPSFQNPARPKEGPEEIAAAPGDGLIAASPRIDSWRRLFDHFPGVSTTLDYLTAVATADDFSFMTSIAAAEGLDDESRSAVEAVAAALRGTADRLAALSPSRYATNVDNIADLIATGVPTLDVEAWGRILITAHPRLSCLAAQELARHADFTKAQLKEAVALRNPDVEGAIMERSAADPEWGVHLAETLRGIDRFADKKLIARLFSVSYTTGALEEINKAEQFTLLAWEALVIADPHGRLDEARTVLDGTSELVETRTKPLRGEHDDLAGYIANNARRVACDALARASDGNVEDLARATTELKRGCFESRESALRALVAMTATNPTAGQTEAIVTAEELAEVVGNLSILDDYWASHDMEAVLASRLAPLVVPIWRASEIADLSDTARRWEVTQPTTSDADLEEALYLEESAVRMGALDELLIRWDKDQLLALLDRYGNQARQYWYNVIAALDEHLYEDSTAPQLLKRS